MKKFIFRSILHATFIAGLTGCVTGSWPQNPQEFKRNFGKPDESYTVNRPIQQVSKVWIKQGKKCLNGRVTQKFVGFGYHPDHHVDYRSSIQPGKDKIELVLQYKMSQQVMLGANPPKDGFIFGLVADAYAVAPNKTRVDVYRHNAPGILGLTADAVKTWSVGRGYGCPDMTRM